MRHQNLFKMKAARMFRARHVWLAVLAVLSLNQLARCHQNQQGQQAFGIDNSQPHIHNAAPPQQQQPPQQQFQGGQQPPPQHKRHVHAQAAGDHQQQSGVFDKSQVQDRDHIKEHLDGVAQADTSKMSEQELQFHYFKMHDSDNNNKLDGSELIKSLIHWHVSEGIGNANGTDGGRPAASGGARIFSDDELGQLIDPILLNDDGDRDGFIDYTEYMNMLKNPNY